MGDLIDRQTAIDALGEEPKVKIGLFKNYKEGRSDQWFDDVSAIVQLPSAQPDTPIRGSITPKTGENGDGRTTGDCISRALAIEKVSSGMLSYDSDVECPEECNSMVEWAVETLKQLPSVQPDTPMRGSITPKTGENGDDRTTDDLISRRKAICTVEDAYRFCDGDIDAYHDAMVASLTELIAERKTGRWISGDKMRDYPRVPYRAWKTYCSECGEEALLDMDCSDYMLTPYCPNCGADMRTVKCGTEIDLCVMDEVGGEA